MKKLLAYLGIDRAVTYTLMGRGWSLLSGVVTLLFVARFLTPDEQGYYYTFASLVAMQILFELGMSIVITQFASHEMAHLSWQNDHIVIGDDQAKYRLRSLFLLVLKWYAAIAAMIVLIVLPAGWLFFSLNHASSPVNWQFAWIGVVIAAAVNVFFLPLIALLEGCGRITEVAQLRMYQSVFGSLAAWAVLASGGGLFAMPAMNIALALTVFVWLWRTKKVFFKDLVHHQAGACFGIHWKAEIWPLQWKIALSWLSGYFIFQLFTPVLFAYRGAIEAGQMGMSFSLANALMSVAMAWMSTKAPQFGTLIAHKDYARLDVLFNSTLIRSFMVIFTLGVVLCSINYALHLINLPLAVRFLDPLPFTLLIGATMLNYVTYAQSTYLRAHKQEPFLLISLISAALIAVSTLTLGKVQGATGIMAGYLGVCTCVGFGWGSHIFIVKRREWRHELNSNGQ
jgi:O-antigen/teichoic acid export membrane protein